MAKHEQPSEKGGKAAKGKSQETPESPETTSPSEEVETNDAALKESAEKAQENFANAAEQEADQKEKAGEAPAPVTLTEITEENGLVYRNYSDGTKQEFAPSQAEAFKRYQNIEWDSEGDKAAAEAISRYAFGQSREEFEESVNDFSAEEKKKLIKIAKKLDMAEIVNAKVLRHIEEEEEKED